MPARVSEAFVLLTYPLKESDLIVSFLARDAGKLRGVARRARRPKGGFGSSLERLSQVKLSYFQKENRELVSINSSDLLQSQFSLMSDYWAGIALDFIAEVSEQLLPAAEPNERYFRLVEAVLKHLRSGEPGAVWRGILYFTFWAVRLAGILPEFRGISKESVTFAEQMSRHPVTEFAPGAFEQQTAADLRKFLIRQIEDLIDRKLKTAPLLSARPF